MTELKQKKVGYVALIGRPNSGKSTFINTLIGEKVSIVSSRPQTTQKNIKGIYNDADSQIIFFDTPGVNEKKDEFYETLKENVLNSLKNADIIVRFIDSSRQYGQEEEIIENILKNVNIPIVQVYSKSDLKSLLSSGAERSGVEGSIKNKKNSTSVILGLNPGIQKKDLNNGFSSQAREGHNDKSLIGIDLPAGRQVSVTSSKGQKDDKVIQISSIDKTGFDELLTEIKKYLKIDFPYYSEDYYTDQDIYTRVTEIIREKIFVYFKEEVPYSVYLEIGEIEEKPKLLKIQVYIYTETDSQKKIIIGKNAENLTKIGKESRVELEEIFDKKIFLSLRVKTLPKWKKNKKLLSKIYN